MQANASKHRYTQTASTHTCYNKGRGLVIKHTLHIVQHICSQTPYMHVTTRDDALQSNMHDKLVNTCTQTTHMHVTARDALLSNTHSILHNTHAHSYIIRHRHIFLPSVARTSPSEGKFSRHPLSAAVFKRC